MAKKPRQEFYLWVSLFLLLLFIFEAGSPVVQAGLKLAM